MLENSQRTLMASSAADAHPKHDVLKPSLVCNFGAISTLAFLIISIMCFLKNAGSSSNPSAEKDSHLDLGNPGH